jgi:hypothetical protein
MGGGGTAMGLSGSRTPVIIRHGGAVASLERIRVVERRAEPTLQTGCEEM